MAVAAEPSSRAAVSVYCCVHRYVLAGAGAGVQHLGIMDNSGQFAVRTVQWCSGIVLGQVRVHLA